MLQATALVSVAWAACALAWSASRAWRRTPPLATAAPAGSASAGVLYAFGAGMSPLAKESARQHPFVYAIGVTYHAGIFIAAALLAAALGGVAVPPPAGRAAGIVTLAAALAGVELLARRATTPLLRGISAADDYVSNLLVDLWLLAAAAASLTPTAAPAFLAASIVVTAYMPLGKIRHCVFFFLSRGLYGARLGRRGIVRTPLDGGSR